MENILYSKRIAQLSDICVIDGKVVKDRGSRRTVVIQEGKNISIEVMDKNIYLNYLELMRDLVDGNLSVKGSIELKLV